MRIRQSIAALLVWVLASSAGDAQAGLPGTASDPAQWRALVQSLEPAALVQVRLTNGQTVKGTIVSVGDDVVTVSVRTRIPVPPRLIPYVDVASLDRARDGLNPGVKVVLGAGAIAASAVLLMAAMFAAAYD